MTLLFHFPACRGEWHSPKTNNTFRATNRAAATYPAFPRYVTFKSKRFRLQNNKKRKKSKYRLAVTLFIIILLQTNEVKRYCTLAILLLFCLETKAQTVRTDILPEGYQRAVVENGDTIPLISLRGVIVFPEKKFKNKREQQQYTKLIRDVKRTLPYAKMIYDVLIETYEYMETLPNEKSKQKHLERMEKELFKEYKPELKKLTFSQGKLLIKLIDRECNQSSYNLLKAYLGSFRAGFWNFFAGLFGASLKSEYDPDGKDAMTERVVVLVENNLI